MCEEFFSLFLYILSFFPIFSIVLCGILYYNTDKFVPLFVSIGYSYHQEALKMHYESQLRLLRETFRKCRIQTTIADMSAIPETGDPQDILLSVTNPGALLKQLLPEISAATVYRLQDAFLCQYICLPLPDLATVAVLIIGPFLAAPLTERQFMEWAENNNIPPRRQKKLKDFYTSLPLLPQTSHLYMLLDAFCEHLWGVGGFSMEYMDRETFIPLPLLSKASPEEEKDDTLWKMKSMELRYNYENELISAVSKGQIHKADQLLGSFSTILFEQRVADPVRNAKNYCIIMNTILRKAAEQGNVHPMYLDSVSSAYAVQIEQILNLEEILPLMTEMFRAYCRLVRKHSTQNHTPLVQQALIYIDANLTGNLNLSTLAQHLNISGSYLSTIFKKETGQTLTDLIAHRRVDKAKELLRTTRLQIQTVAQHCGIVDVHYFSKIFKKVTGQTPKEYREALKR